MRAYRDRAIVLRQYKLREADLIVNLLTEQHGLVRAVARAARRTRSKLGAHLEPFGHTDVLLHPGRNLDLVVQAVSIDSFGGDIVSDYGKYTSACAILETAERLAGEERTPVEKLHRLTVGALRAIAAGQRSRDLVVDAYVLRAMDIAGWMPALNDCARCGTTGPHRGFNVAVGGAVCVHCRPAGSVTPSPGVLELMDDLYRGRWENTDVAPAIINQSTGLIAAHVQWHMERKLRTFGLIERHAPGQERDGTPVTTPVGTDTRLSG